MKTPQQALKARQAYQERQRQEIERDRRCRIKKVVEAKLDDLNRYLGEQGLPLDQMCNLVVDPSMPGDEADEVRRQIEERAQRAGWQTRWEGKRLYLAHTDNLPRPAAPKEVDGRTLPLPWYKRLLGFSEREIEK